MGIGSTLTVMVLDELVTGKLRLALMLAIGELKKSLEASAVARLCDSSVALTTVLPEAARTSTTATPSKPSSTTLNALALKESISTSTTSATSMTNSSKDGGGDTGGRWCCNARHW